MSEDIPDRVSEGCKDQFDFDYYLRNNPDININKNDKHFHSLVWAHFVKYGRFEHNRLWRFEQVPDSYGEYEVNIVRCLDYYMHFGSRLNEEPGVNVPMSVSDFLLRFPLADDIELPGGSKTLYISGSFSDFTIGPLGLPPWKFHLKETVTITALQFPYESVGGKFKLYDKNDTLLYEAFIVPGHLVADFLIFLHVPGVRSIGLERISTIMSIRYKKIPVTDILSKGAIGLTPREQL